MTTIATDGRTVAADRAATDSFRLILPNPKIVRIRNCIVGCSGHGGDCEAFRYWFDHNRENHDGFPDMKGRDFTAIAVSDEGILCWDVSAFPTLVPAPHAEGTGATLAMGAMVAGADPKRAVEIACRFDPYSYLPVDVLKVPRSDKKQDR